MEEVQHFPSQQDNRNDDHEDRQDFPKRKAAAVGLKVARSQAQDVKRRKGKHQRPENIVDFLARGPQ